MQLRSIRVTVLVVVLCSVAAQVFDFASCDRNQDDKLSVHEMEACLKDSRAVHGGFVNPQEVFEILDTNKDGIVSKSEHEALMKFAASQKSSEVNIKMKDGTVRTMSYDEMIAHSQKSMQGLTLENDMLKQTKEGTGDIETLTKENPNLDRFIRLGRWIHFHLRTEGVSTGEIANLRSLNEEEAQAASLEGHSLAHGDDFEVLVEITTREPDNTYKKFEVLVEKNKAKYRKPHLAMRELWLLDEHSNRVQQIHVKQPRLKVTFWERAPKMAMLFVCILGFMTVILVIIRTIVQRSKPKEE